MSDARNLGETAMCNPLRRSCVSGARARNLGETAKLPARVQPSPEHPRSKKQDRFLWGSVLGGMGILKNQSPTSRKNNPQDRFLSIKKPIPNIKKNQSPGSVFTNPGDRFLQSPQTYPQTFKENRSEVLIQPILKLFFFPVGWVCMALFQAPKHGNGHGSLSNLTKSH